MIGKRIFPDEVWMREKMAPAEAAGCFCTPKDSTLLVVLIAMIQLIVLSELRMLRMLNELIQLMQWEREAPPRLQIRGG